MTRNKSSIYMNARMYKGMEMEERRRMDYYTSHPEHVDFIIDFFKVKKGMRPRGAMYTKYNGKISFDYFNRITSERYGGKYGYPLTDINEKNAAIELRVYKNIYTFPFIFKNKARKAKSKQDAKSNIIGVMPIMDVDSPHLYSDNRSLERINLLDNSIAARDANKLLDKFRIIVKEELSSIGLWENTRLMHSGNGMYIILPEFYGSMEEIYEYEDVFIEFKKYVNSKIGMRLTHEKILAWNELFKIPFVFHSTYDRVSIPIDKDATFGYKLSTTSW